MVGIILASHGEFANGILQSGAMIFGDQVDVKAVTLQPSEGPDDLKAKMEAAIATFENQDEVLFLVDLWGGTPFNQANGLIAGHEDKWAIVTGLNLPMLIETYASRMSMETAHEIAKHVTEVAREGVKVKPEELEPETKVAAQAINTQSQGAIPEGTVLGDGHIKYVLARIDTRLLHGQVATTWTKTTQPNRIIVVSDAVSKDKLRKQMIEQAAPPGVKANVVPIDKMIQVAKDPRFGNTKAMLLFETPQDALRAIEGGVDIKELNIGSMAHSIGKVVVNKAIAMGPEDIETIEKIKAKGIEILDVTLHVGLGTFRPVKVDDVLEHHMHSEYYMIEPDVADKLNQAKQNGQRIIAVGTTSTRTLEANMKKYGKFTSVHENTDIFIYPGYKYEAIDCLITNFHLPKSTLLMLISAFASKEFIFKAYQEAIDEKYRFFSFGDSMFIM